MIDDIQVLVRQHDLQRLLKGTRPVGDQQIAILEPILGV